MTTTTGMPKRMTNAIVTPVLGMHHSGSSEWSRCLNLLGVELGQAPDPPKNGGHKRFWENEFFHTLNIRILRAMDRDFHGYGGYTALAEIPELAVGINLNQEDEDFVGEYIARTFACAHWGWKDPASVLLFPFWLNILTSLGFRDIRPLLVVRHPAACVQALLREADILSLANQMRQDPTTLCLEMWRVYNQVLLTVLDETDCFISIHRWLGDADHARGELQRAAQYLEIGENGALQEAITWLDPGTGTVPVDEDGDAAFVDAESLALYWTLVSRAEGQRAGT